MNQKGQDVLEYTFLFGGAVLVVVIVIALVTQLQETEFWQEEWQCAEDGWRDTGKLINCKEETQRETEMIIRGNLNKNIYVAYNPPNCKELGENWQEDCFWDGMICDIWDVNTWQCTIICEKEWQEIICEHEQKCVKQTPSRCLITRKKHEGSSTASSFPVVIWTETRECDKEGSK